MCSGLSGPSGPLGLHGLDGLKGVKGDVGSRGRALPHTLSLLLEAGPQPESPQRAHQHHAAFASCELGSAGPLAENQAAVAQRGLQQQSALAGNTQKAFVGIFLWS